MVKTLISAMLLVVAALFGGAFLLPSEVHVERSITIDRPPATVFAVLNGFRLFDQWSPWAERDPGARFETSGPDRGAGARLAWEGDPQLVGTGYQQITLSQPYRRIEVDLDFGEQGEAEAYYDLEPVGEGVEVTWGFDSDLTAGRGFIDGLIGRYLGLFFDRWIGADYEQGLRSLKALVEAMPEADFADLDVRVVDVTPEPALLVSGTAGAGPGEVAQALAQAYGDIGRFMARRGMAHSGQPVAIMQADGEDGYRFEAAIPTETAGVTGEGAVRVGTTPGGRAVRAVHVGPYDTMPETYDKLAAYMAAHGLAPGALSWERYVSDPGDTPSHALITHIFFSVDAAPGAG